MSSVSDVLDDSAEDINPADWADERTLPSVAPVSSPLVSSESTDERAGGETPISALAQKTAAAGLLPAVKSGEGSQEGGDQCVTPPEGISAVKLSESGGRAEKIWRAGTEDPEFWGTPVQVIRGSSAFMTPPHKCPAPQMLPLHKCSPITIFSFSRMLVLHNAQPA